MLAVACSSATPATPTATNTPAPTPTATPDPVGPPEPSGARALAHVQKLSVDIGPRIAGSDAAIEARDYLRDTLQSYGYDVTLQEFTFDSSAFLPGRVQAAGDDIPGYALRGSPSSSASGPIVDGGIGEPASLTDAQGAVALIRRGELTFTEKVQNAQDAGAVAVVVYNNEDGPLFGDLSSDADIPAVGIPRQDGEALLARLAEGPLEATVTVSSPEGTAYNVVARPPGTDTCETVTGGHYDSVASPGADDNASGTASVLEVARVAAADDLPGDNCFVLFSAEEFGLFGSKAYVDSLAPEQLGALDAMLNLDVVGLDAGLTLIGTPDLVEASRVEAQRLGIDAQAGALPTGSGSDHMSFADAGVPVVMFYRDDSRIHTAEDTAARVDAQSLEEVVRVSVAVLETLSGP